MGVLAIRDETLTGSVMHELMLKFDADTITVRELIEARIRDEVVRYEERIKNVASNIRHNLIQPSDLESRLNPKKKSKPIDVQKQIDTAIQAFEGNGFLLLVDDEQVDELTQKVKVSDKTQVSFIKMTPLVGG